MSLRPLAFVEDAVNLYRVRTRNSAAQAKATAAGARELDQLLTEAQGSGLRGKRVLIVGTGQTLREFYAYSSLGAKVTGIDTDVVPLGFDLRAYVSILRNNGPVRLLKTVGRKLLGIDAAFERALTRELKVKRLVRGSLLVADATRLPFPDGSFDVVYSFAVFEHLPDPVAVMREVARVLANDGCASISTHIYAAENGCHDLRIFAGERASIPYWAHLRPDCSHTVREACYMNKWRLDAWEAAFTDAFPGAEFALQPHHDEHDQLLRAELHRLRSAGELSDYDDRELLTVNLITRWHKSSLVRSVDPSSTISIAPCSLQAPQIVGQHGSKSTEAG